MEELQAVREAQVRQALWARVVARSSREMKAQPELPEPPETRVRQALQKLQAYSADDSAEPHRGCRDLLERLDAAPSSQPAASLASFPAD